MIVENPAWFPVHYAKIIPAIQRLRKMGEKNREGGKN